MKNTPVYDHPLALMDARTFQKEHERPHAVHIDFLVFVLHNLNAGFIYDENQQWYYYPYPTEQEVLVFTQYSKGKHFANPHTSFLVPNRPKETETPRQSIELRAAVLSPQGWYMIDDCRVTRLRRRYPGRHSFDTRILAVSRQKQFPKEETKAESQGEEQEQ